VVMIGSGPKGGHLLKTA